MIEDSQTCQCIRIDCWHIKGECDEPPIIRGGICTTCRWYRNGDPAPGEDDPTIQHEAMITKETR